MNKFVRYLVLSLPVVASFTPIKARSTDQENVIKIDSWYAVDVLNAMKNQESEKEYCVYLYEGMQNKIEISPDIERMEAAASRAPGFYNGTILTSVLFEFEEFNEITDTRARLKELLIQSEQPFALIPHPSGSLILRDLTLSGDEWFLNQEILNEEPKYTLEKALGILQERYNLSIEDTEKFSREYGSMTFTIQPDTKTVRDFLLQILQRIAKEEKRDVLVSVKPSYNSTIEKTPQWLESSPKILYTSLPDDWGVYNY